MNKLLVVYNERKDGLKIGKRPLVSNYDKLTDGTFMAVAYNRKFYVTIVLKDEKIVSIV